MGAITEPPRIWYERLKYPDRPHYGAWAWLLGEDASGTWIAHHSDTTIYRGESPIFIGAYRAVFFIPRGEWFTAFWLADHEIEL